MRRASFTLRELAEHVQGNVIGDAGMEICGLSSLAAAGEGDISHLSSAAYRGTLSGSRASAVILRESDLASWSGSALVVAEPYLAFAKISQLFAHQPELPTGVDPTARVHAAAELHPDVSVGPYVTIGAGARLASGVKVFGHSVIGERCNLDIDVTLMPNVVLYADVALGPRTVVHSGAVIGADGFGFAADECGHHHPIAQLGGVRIGADVSIGANTTIDRGAIDDTVVEDGVKIDNHVQVGHNCRIGAHTVICGCVGIAGSVTIGRHCVLAGGSGAGGDGPIELVDRVVLSAATIALSSIREPGVYSGAVLHSKTSQWKRNALRLRRLDDLHRRVAELEKQANVDGAT